MSINIIAVKIINLIIYVADGHGDNIIPKKTENGH